MLIYIWAQDENGVIGKKGVLPWNLPNDLKFFKEVTLDQTIVMGRNTFEGMGKRLLPRRHSIVVSNVEDYDANGAEVITDVEMLIEDAKHEDIYIIGGAVLFDGQFDGDTYFPKDFPWEKFVKVKSMDGTVDEKNIYPHTFEIYQKIEDE